jgi:hypothetical protein
MPTIIWTPHTNFTSLSIGSSLVTLDGLRELVQNLLSSAKRFLATEVLMELRLPEMDAVVQQQQQQQQRYVDNHRDSRPGYSFLDDPDNSLQQYEGCLHRAFLSSPSTANTFVVNSRVIGDDGNIQYNEGGCRAWLRKTGEFLDILTALIHIGGGQAARAEELASLLIRNSRNNHRGVYYRGDINTIMLCTTYHKGRSIKGSDRVISRTLPKSVADLLLQYLVIVRPLEV